MVAVDPSGSKRGDEVGIIVGGRIEKHGYILADLSGHYSPAEWAGKAVEAFNEYQANAIVAEVNFGGDMVERTVRTVEGGEQVPFKTVYASRGKDIRAEPVIARYQRGRIHHVGSFGTLERQQCTWTPGVSNWSPDRMDALVWACRDLLDRRRYQWSGTSSNA